MRLPQEDICQALGVAPALKYESDGGPGIEAIMKLLLGSQQARQDRETFFKTQVIFWLLAAIDGHAKNFGLFLEPGSAYRMTPLYDVISAHPLMAKGSIAVERAKMAMALKGKNRHYRWARMEPRHFLSTARHVGFSTEQASTILQEVAERTEPAIAEVTNQLPEGFPAAISEPIFEGMRLQATKIDNR